MAPATPAAIKDHARSGGREAPAGPCGEAVPTRRAAEKLGVATGMAGSTGALAAADEELVMAVLCVESRGRTKRIKSRTFAAPVRPSRLSFRHNAVNQRSLVGLWGGHDPCGASCHE